MREHVKADLTTDSECQTQMCEFFLEDFDHLLSDVVLLRDVSLFPHDVAVIGYDTARHDTLRRDVQ